ncbi:hypothetical protein Tco_0195808 [Tanacetum coccineum]
MIQNHYKPDDPTTKIIEPLNKMTGSNKKQYFSSIGVMNYLLQGIPNDIYNSIDACKTGKQMWEQIRRLMHGSKKTKQQRHSRLVDKFDKFVAIEGESLSSVYNANIKETEFDHLFDTLSQYEPHVIASRAKKAARNHDPLALVAHSNVHSSHSHASPSYSHSSQPYYVTHPSSVIDYEEDYQGKIQRDAQEDKNQEVIQDGRVDIQSNNVGYDGNGNRNAWRSNINQIATAGNGIVHQIEANDQIIQRVPRTESNPGKEQMLLAMKDEVGGNLDEEENDFMLDNHYGDDSLEELNATVIMMASIQPTDDKADAKPTSDADALGEVNVSQIHLKSRMHSESVHEHTNHAKLKTVINTSDDDQIDSSIIFDDPYVENNGGVDEHDSNAHGYQIPKHLKKAIKAQPKMYDGERLQSTKLKIDSPDSEETLEDAEESRLK